MTELSAHQGDPRPVEDESIVLIRESIERMRSWISDYLRGQIGCHASPNDFTNRIERRLIARLESGALEAHNLDNEVKNVLRLLIYEDRRAEFRKSLVCCSSAEIENVRDPDSLQFALRLELESQIQAIRQRIPDHLLPIIDTLYGFSDAEELSIEELARRLGIRRNTLNRRLSRLFQKLRLEFGVFE
jgi:hypothetical protein